MLEERILFFDVELYGSIFLEKEKKTPTPDYVARIFKDRSWEKTRKNNEMKFYFLMESKF